MKKSPTHPPPKGLSPAAVTWWNRLQREFNLDAEDALFLLESALRSFDRMCEASGLIDQHGICIVDRYGQLRSNPATTVERDSRASMLATFKQLNLDIAPPQRPGRPAGR